MKRISLLVAVVIALFSVYAWSQQNDIKEKPDWDKNGMEFRKHFSAELKLRRRHGPRPSALPRRHLQRADGSIRKYHVTDPSVFYQGNDVWHSAERRYRWQQRYPATRPAGLLPRDAHPRYNKNPEFFLRNRWCRKSPEHDRLGGRPQRPGLVRQSDQAHDNE